MEQQSKWPDQWSKNKEQKNGTRKIAELPDKPCNHPGHNPPSHMVYEDGIYEHVCPACGKVKRFTVRNPTL